MADTPTPAPDDPRVEAACIAYIDARPRETDMDDLTGQELWDAMPEGWRQMRRRLMRAALAAADAVAPGPTPTDDKPDRWLVDENGRDHIAHRSHADAVAVATYHGTVVALYRRPPAPAVGDDEVVVKREVAARGMAVGPPLPFRGPGYRSMLVPPRDSADDRRARPGGPS